VSTSVIENLLAERLGFDSQTIGSAAVDALVRQCMSEAGFSDVVAYARWVECHEDAWERLVDRAVISETRFLRDRAPFELAAEIAIAHHRRRPERRFRILSCPCSTGEEPYSLVFSLLEGGVSVDTFVIDAVDVSRQAIDAAHQGVFRATALGGVDPRVRDRYFERVGTESWRVIPAARAPVRFRQDNLLARDFLRDEVPYDLVFCRNLLIYLLPEARTTVMAALQRLTAPDATLVVGHAEAALVRQHGFSPTGRHGAFAFVRSRVARFTSPPHRKDASWTPGQQAGASADTRRSTAASRTEATPESVGAEPLAQADRLAEAGQIPEAFRVCAEYLDHVPDSADGHYLIGILHEAAGRLDLALRSMRRVLYLNPSHRKALLFLAAKQEASGDRPGAARLRARAERASAAQVRD
jgi:chemotaxis protein methyltransferase WspC